MFRVVLLLSILALALLAACGPPHNATTGEVSSEQANDGMYPVQDLALVGNTGRPQFLNGFATW